MRRDSSRRTVLFVLPDFNGGGAEQAVLRIVRAWPPERGVPAVAVKALSGSLSDAFRQSGVPVFDLGGKERHSIGSSMRSALALRRLISVERPAAVVAVLSAPFVVAAARSVRQRPKVVVSVQNPVLSETRLSSRSFWRSTVTRVSFRFADHVLPISPGIAHELAELGVPVSRMTVLPNPVDTAEFAPLRRERRERSVAVVARLERQKRVDVAVRAFAAACLDGWRLDVYGTGPQRCELENLADALGLADRVFFHGFTSDVPTVLRTVSVLLLTSEYEGFGNVLVEALAAGVRIVSTDAPWGPRYVLDDGRFGELCPVNDVDAVAAALRRAAKTPDDGDGVARRACRAQEFDTRLVVASLVAALLDE